MSIAADWERLLSSAARVPRLVPDAIFGETREKDDEAVRRRFAIALKDLERVSGWLPTPVGRIAVDDARLDHIETRIHDQMRFGPLKTTVEVGPWGDIVVPTFAEMLRIKTWLVISRNATRDYVDAGALAVGLGRRRSINALCSLDSLYPQTNGASAIQQAARQLAEPRPFDIESFRPSRLTFRATRLRWIHARRRCLGLAIDLVLAMEPRG